MNIEQTEKLYDTFKVLHEAEKSLSNFYRLCADKWDGDRDFWERISQDETRHADNLVKIANMVSDSPEKFKPGMDMGKDVLDGFLQGIKMNIQSMKSGSLSLQQALLNAENFERSILEKNYEKIIKTDDEEVNGILDKIHEDTERHRKAIEERVKQHVLENPDVFSYIDFNTSSED